MSKIIKQNSTLGGLLLLVWLFPSVSVAAEGEINGADTAWILTSTALVLFMTVPGLSLFYAGLVRTKNVLSVLMQCFGITVVISITWLVVGYSIAFGPAESGLWGGVKQSLPERRGSGFGRRKHS